MKGLVRFLWGMAALATMVAATMYWNPLWVADQGLHLHMWQQGMRTKFVQLPEGRVRFFEMQPKDGGGVPLVLVHGLGGRGEDWAGLMPRMVAQGFHCYGLDLLGYGEADKPADSDFSIATEENVVLHFMDAEHLQRADVLGWSMGGWIVMRLALDHPERVDRLVVVDGAGITFQSDADTALFSPKDEAGVARLLHAMSPNVRLPPAFVDRAIVRKNTQREWIIDRSMRAMRSGKGLVDFQLAKMEPPLMFVWGSEDVLVPPSVGKTMHELDPRSVLVTAQGCGHIVPLECPQTLANAMTGFLKSDPVMQGGEIELVGDVRRVKTAVKPDAN